MDAILHDDATTEGGGMPPVPRCMQPSDKGEFFQLIDFVSRYLQYVVGAPFILFAGTLFCNGALNLREHVKVSRWEKTSGYLLDAKAGDSVPSVRYEYFVRGVRHESRVFSRLRISGGAVWSQDRVAELRRLSDTNSGLAVVYDPSNPSTSAIYYGAYPTIEYFAVACIAFGIGVIAIKCCILDRKDREEEVQAGEQANKGARGFKPKTDGRERRK